LSEAVSLPSTSSRSISFDGRGQAIVLFRPLAAAGSVQDFACCELRRRPASRSISRQCTKLPHLHRHTVAAIFLLFAIVQGHRGRHTHSFSIGRQCTKLPPLHSVLRHASGLSGRRLSRDCALPIDGSDRALSWPVRPLRPASRSRSR